MEDEVALAEVEQNVVVVDRLVVLALGLVQVLDVPLLVEEGPALKYLV